MIYHVDPVFFSLGPISIRYYGIIYMLSFIFLYVFLNRVAKKGEVKGLSKADIEQFVFYVVIWTVIGSRLFEILFYSGDYFLKYPLKMFAIWEGGLSFHGGLFGFFFYSLYFCRQKKVPFLTWLDYCSVVASFSLFLGRIANFINGELYGLPVDDQISPPWYAVLFEGSDPQHLYRYPVQLFESLGNLITFIIILIIWRVWKKKMGVPLNGVLGFTFLFLYGIFRFIVEFLKDYARDTFLGLTTGQLLTVPLILFGIWGITRSFNKGFKSKKLNS
jgi:phosphatidylglycerol:prolipoprotein diacylglycerol transferase